MAEDSSKIPVSTDESAPSGLRPRRSLESLRQGIDRLFDDFGIGTWRPSFRGSFFDVDPLRKTSRGMMGARCQCQNHRTGGRSLGEGFPTIAAGATPMELTRRSRRVSLSYLQP